MKNIALAFLFVVCIAFGLVTADLQEKYAVLQQSKLDLMSEYANLATSYEAALVDLTNVTRELTECRISVIVPVEPKNKPIVPYDYQRRFDKELD
jgi:hypothetical protein